MRIRFIKLYSHSYTTGQMDKLKLHE